MKHVTIHHFSLSFSSWALALTAAIGVSGVVTVLAAAAGAADLAKYLSWLCVGLVALWLATTGMSRTR